MDLFAVIYGQIVAALTIIAVGASGLSIWWAVIALPLAAATVVPLRQVVIQD